ncbi:unnamed protein product [Prunus armeniaca]
MFSILRPPDSSRSRRVASYVRGSNWELQGDCQNFGRMSRFLVSGPDIGVMSVTRQDPSRVSRNFRGGSYHVALDFPAYGKNM